MKAIFNLTLLIILTISFSCFSQSNLSDEDKKFFADSERKLRNGANNKTIHTLDKVYNPATLEKDIIQMTKEFKDDNWVPEFLFMTIIQMNQKDEWSKSKISKTAKRTYRDILKEGIDIWVATPITTF